MRCPFCNEDNDKVIDSRSTDGGRCIRRRRECVQCERRFTTYERVEEKVKLTVIKRDGARMPYDRRKLTEGIRRAAFKRPISAERIDQIVDEVEEQLTASHEKEVSSQTIGEVVSNVLRRVDQVAYVRYASVYRQFQDVGEFIDEARDVLERSERETPGQQDLFEQAGES